MTAPNISHQSGHARAYIDHEPYSMLNSMYVMHEQHAVTYENGCIVMRLLQEGVLHGDAKPFLEWSDPVEDTIVDIFKAVGKALEIYSDAPSQAYKQGFAEGQAAVLREWNESLRG